MHSSLCTGGLLAITAALSHDLALPTSSDGPMSYGAIGYLSCKTSTGERTSTVSTRDTHGCQDAKACLSRVSSFLKEKSYVYTSPVAVIPSLLGISRPAPPTVPSASAIKVARAGPLQTTTTVKRE